MRTNRLGMQKAAAGTGGPGAQELKHQTMHNTAGVIEACSKVTNKRLLLV